MNRSRRGGSGQERSSGDQNTYRHVLLRLESYMRFGMSRSLTDVVLFTLANEALEQLAAQRAGLAGEVWSNG